MQQLKENTEKQLFIQKLEEIGKELDRIIERCAYYMKKDLRFLPIEIGIQPRLCR